MPSGVLIVYTGLVPVLFRVTASQPMRPQVASHQATRRCTDRTAGPRPRIEGEFLFSVGSPTRFATNIPPRVAVFSLQKRLVCPHCLPTHIYAHFFTRDRPARFTLPRRKLTLMRLKVRIRIKQDFPCICPRQRYALRFSSISAPRGTRLSLPARWYRITTRPCCLPTQA